MVQLQIHRSNSSNLKFLPKLIQIITNNYQPRISYNDTQNKEKKVEHQPKTLYVITQ